MKTTQHIIKYVISCVLLIVCSVSFLDIQYACAQPSSPYSVKIPTKFGKVKERYRGDNNKVIVHIQDAHTSYEAQENIANIIEYLVDDNVVDVVAVEGAEGTIDLEPFRLFPVDDVRRRVAANLTAYGYLTGSELAGIGMEKEVELFGVEDMGIYYRNLDKFRNVMNKREDILVEIEKIEEILNNLKAPLYTKELYAFDEITIKYYDEKINFIEFTKSVIEYAQKVNVDLYDHINVALFMESLQEAAGTSEDDKFAVEKERAALIYDLLKVATDQKLLTLLHKLEENGHELSQEKQLLLDSFLVKQLRGYALEERKYEHFVKNAKFAEKFGRVDKGALLDEVEELAYTISKVLARTSVATQEHVDLVHNVRLMKHLIELKVVPSQVESYRENAAAYSSVRYMNFLREQAKVHNVRYHPSAQITLLDEVMDVAVQFYRFAEARSRILVKNTLSRMKKNDRSVIALVAGGYHTDGMVEALKKKGYSYLVVSPRIDNIDLTVPYMERMMNVKSAAQLRFESAFNTIVNAQLTNKQDNERKLIELIKNILEVVLFMSEEGKLPVRTHPRIGKHYDDAIIGTWQKDFQEFGDIKNAKVIEDNGDIYVVLPDPDRVIKYEKEAVRNRTKDTSGVFVELPVVLKNQREVSGKTFIEVINEMFARVDFMIGPESMRSRTDYYENWSALVDAVRHGMIADADLKEGLLGNLKVAYNASVAPFRQEQPTKTIVFTSEIIRVIGAVYGEAAAKDQLLRGVEVLQTMRDNKYENREVDMLIKSYYGTDVDITANIEFICSEEEKKSLKQVFKDDNAYHLVDIGEFKRQGMPVTPEEKKRSIIDEMIGRGNITIVTHRKEKLGTDVVALTTDNIKMYNKNGVNLVTVFKAPNEVINVILKLFDKGMDIFSKVAQMLDGVRQELIKTKAFDPSA
ncbi:MAG: hypothetical protein JW938_03830 [Candidatus Omnitrophica bacterium]|nr:hypothetical protein [Candidatus Omnitrophota bacterium]